MGSFDDLLSPFYEALDSSLSSSSLNFPTSFNLAARASRVLENPNASIKEYSLMIQSEPVLLAKVLRMANSIVANPYRREVINAFEAAQRLGIKKIRCLVYLVVMDQIKHDLRSEELRRMANILWKHSLDIACMSYSIARHLGVCDPDDAMLSGIMIDIGQFFIISRLPEFPEILKNDKCVETLIKDAHTKVARQILDVLMLPKVVLEVYNHNLRHHPDWPIVNIYDVVMFSNIMSMVKNPFLQTKTDLKKRDFLDGISLSHHADIDHMLEVIEPAKIELYNSLTQ